MAITVSVGMDCCDMRVDMCIICDKALAGNVTVYSKSTDVYEGEVTLFEFWIYPAEP